MKHPKLKNALLCRILTYVVVLGGFIAPIVLIACIPAINDMIKLALIITLSVGLIVYIVKNFVVLMSMDVMLASLHCYNTARTQFPFAKSPEKIEKRLRRYGKDCKADGIYPQAHMIRYSFSSPFTIYSKGIERIALVYHTEFLDKEKYIAIANSAKSSSNALSGRKRALFLDSSQKRAPLNRVTVMFIFAKRVDEALLSNLYKTVSSQDGDGYKIAFVPCVIDLEKRVCVFNCLREPYFGYAYPVKNRGIRLVRKCVFGGKLPLRNNPYRVEPVKKTDTEQSLWSFWHATKKELITDEKEAKKRFESMESSQIILKDDMLYIKWGSKGACVPLETDEEKRTVEVGSVIAWDYPKQNTISKKDIADMERLIFKYFQERGFTCTFDDES